MAKANKADAVGCGIGDALAIVKQGSGMVRIQKARKNRMTGAARQKFLDHLAATCNVVMASKETGISFQRFYHLRKRDPDFAAAWQQATAVGV